MNSAASGILLLLVAGAMNGSFTLPMKFTRRWAWENTWFVWTIFALLIFPPLLTFGTVPALASVYHQASAGVIWVVVACGAGWGISQVFFGLAVDAIGIALAFSVILGLSAAVGSVVPLIRLHPEQALTSEGLAVLTGVVLVLIGVGICAAAGRRREANLGQGPARVSVMMGLLFSVISGVGSALVNLGLAFGAPLLVLAEHAGAAPTWSPNAVWLPLMVAGAVPNLVYCLYLMRKNRTGNRFAQGGTGGHYVLAGMMGVFWFASTVIYGIAAGDLGKLGAVLGWPLFMSLIVITASLWGVATGEWRGSGRQPLRIMMGGVAVLIIAIFVLATAPHWA
jgi:L-rhamnose-H+ transport protein